MTACALALALWYAWRYSRAEIDPDWAMFNLQAFTGSRYGRDFLDCKTPLIHWWYYAIARVVGRDVGRVRFAHHLLVSLPGIIVGGWAGLAFVTLVNSGWLWAFHGNVGQVPAGLVFIGLLSGDPWVGGLCVGLAVASEPKLLPSAAVMFIVNGWYLPGAVYAVIAGAVALCIRLLSREYWGYLTEANLTIARRMTTFRREMAAQGQTMFHASTGVLYILPWLVFAVQARPDWRYWLAPALFVGVTLAGLAVRNNHALPLAGWIAAAGLPPGVTLALIAADLISARLYLPDLWKTFYGGLSGPNQDARIVGEWLRDKPGRLWVDGLMTNIYIYARKPIEYGLNEQAEIREVAHERREKWRQAFKASPPEWVVLGFAPGYEFTGAGYRLEAQTSASKIYRRL